MSKLRVAVLEDEPMKLKELVGQLRETALVEVVGYARDRAAFMEVVASKAPEVLILDIDLGGEPEGGLAVARSHSLPVLFISGHIAEHLKAIELVDEGSISLPVGQLTKPVSAERLRAKLEKFAHQVRSCELYKPLRVRNSIKGEDMLVPPDRIVCIQVDEDGRKQHNKRLYFVDRKPVVMADLTLNRLHEWGFPKELFIQIAKNGVVNRRRIVKRSPTAVQVEVMTRQGEVKPMTLAIGDAFRKALDRGY